MKQLQCFKSSPSPLPAVGLTIWEIKTGRTEEVLLTPLWNLIPPSSNSKSWIPGVICQKSRNPLRWSHSILCRMPDDLLRCLYLTLLGVYIWPFRCLHLTLLDFLSLFLTVRRLLLSCRPFVVITTNCYM